MLGVSKKNDFQNILKANPYTHTVRVEFEEVDSYRIVHHSKLLIYLERARTHFFYDHGIALENMPYAVLVYRANLRFIKPAYFFDELSVEVTIGSIRSFFFTMHERILRHGEVLVSADISHALQDHVSGEAIALPDEMSTFLTSLSNDYPC